MRIISFVQYDRFRFCVEEKLDLTRARSFVIGKCYPFSSENYGDILLTLGYAVTAAVFVPICLMDLKVRQIGRVFASFAGTLKIAYKFGLTQENAAWQIFGFFILMTISTQFVICFILDGLSWKHVSMWGETWDSMLGVILFNFALVMAIPAWLSEKKNHIRVGTVVWGSTVLSTILYILVGLLGAMAIPHINANALEPMVSGAFGGSLRIGASVFAFFIIGLDIPLFSVLTRYNLTNSGLCSPRLANFLVVWLPWSTAWLFYQGSAIDELLSWGGILFTSAVAFLLPLYLAIYVLKQSSSSVGSIAVYGQWLRSKETVLYATWVLFGVALASVLMAILGQALYDEEKNNLLDTSEYVDNNVGEHIGNAGDAGDAGN